MSLLGGNDSAARSDMPVFLKLHEQRRRAKLPVRRHYI